MTMTHRRGQPTTTRGALFNYSPAPNVTYTKRKDLRCIECPSVRPIDADEELLIFYGHALWFAPAAASEEGVGTTGAGARCVGGPARGGSWVRGDGRWTMGDGLWVIGRVVLRCVASDTHYLRSERAGRIGTPPSLQCHDTPPCTLPLTESAEFASPSCIPHTTHTRWHTLAALLSIYRPPSS
jgi:hypothetical protein